MYIYILYVCNVVLRSANVINVMLCDVMSCYAMYTCVYIYIYNYICVCMYVCVCVCLQAISVCARATGTLVYDGMSMLLIVDQTVGPFLVVVPVAKPETKCAPQFSCFDF